MIRANFPLPSSTTRGRLLDFASRIHGPNLLNESVSVGVVEAIEVNSRTNMARDHLYPIAYL